MGEVNEMEWGPQGARPLVSAADCILRTRAQAPSDQGSAGVRPGLQIAVAVESPGQRIGLEDPQELAAEALVSPPEGEPYLLVAHGLSRFCRLAFAGDLDCLRCLFASDADTLISTGLGQELRRQRDVFLAGDARRGLIERFARLQAASQADPDDRLIATEALVFGQQALALLERAQSSASKHESPPLGADGSPDAATAQIGDLGRRLEESPISGMAPPPELMIGEWLTGAYRRWWDESVEPMWLE